MTAALLCALLLASDAAVRPADEAPPPARRGPLEMRDEWLLAEPRITLPAASPDPLPAGRTLCRFDFALGSDFGTRGTPLDLAYIVDGEHRTGALEVQRGVSPSVTVGVRLPVRWRGGGFMDGVINWWHRTSDLPDNDRGLYPTDRFRIEGRDQDGRALQYSGRAGTGLGNLALSALWGIRRSERSAAVALVGRVELPTATGPFADSGAQAGVQIVAVHPLARAFDVYAGAGATASGSDRVSGIVYTRRRAHGFLVIEWRPGRRLSLLAETSASSRQVTNVSAYPGLQLYLRMGAKLDLARRLRLEAGFVEGLKSIQATTDFGVQAGLSRTF